MAKNILVVTDRHDYSDLLLLLAGDAGIRQDYASIGAPLPPTREELVRKADEIQAARGCARDDAITWAADHFSGHGGSDGIKFLLDFYSSEGPFDSVVNLESDPESAGRKTEYIGSRGSLPSELLVFSGRIPPAGESDEGLRTRSPYSAAIVYSAFDNADCYKRALDEIGRACCSAARIISIEPACVVAAASLAYPRLDDLYLAATPDNLEPRQLLPGLGFGSDGDMVVAEWVVK